ncbi:MAG: DMT family transporter [Gammaproteobacteria bacterium]
MTGNKRTIGIVMIVASAVGYGLQPIFGKLAYAEGISPSTVTFGRFLLTAALFELHYLFLPCGARASAKELLTTIGIGIVFAAAAFCYFISLQYLSPVVFSFVYYTYPAMTLVVGALFFGEKITARHAIGAVMTIAGMPLLLGGGEVAASTAGVLWILGCSVCMAFFFRLQAFLPGKRCELYHAKIMARTMALVFLLWWLADGMPDARAGGALWWVFWIGLISTYMAFTASIIGISMLGANHAALLSGQEPLWTALFALAVLGVLPSSLQMIGAAMVLAAVFYINRHCVGR